MIITPADINSYIFCPIRHFNPPKENRSISDIWCEKIREAIIKTEKRVLLHNSYITVKKINKKWDEVWWDYGFSNGIDIDRIKKLTVAASIKFLEYCKYDFSTDVFENLAVDVSLDKDFSNGVLIRSHIDIVKRDRRDKTKHIYLIDFNSIDESTMHTNIGIAAKILPYFINGCNLISYINIDFSKKKLKVSRYTFRKEDVERYTQSLFYISRGIRSRIAYPNMYNCKECGVCSGITSIRKQ